MPSYYSDMVVMHFPLNVFEMSLNLIPLGIVVNSWALTNNGKTFIHVGDWFSLCSYVSECAFISCCVSAEGNEC